MRDAFIPLYNTAPTSAQAVGTPAVITATGTGTAVDLLKGTNVQKDGIAGPDLLGMSGLGNMLAAVIVCSNVGGTGTPSLTLTLNESDDNTTFYPLGTAVIAATGDYQIPFAPTKRYVRLDPTAISGTTPTFSIDAVVGTKEF